MAMRLRYAGEFYSVIGTVWRCEILQAASSAFASVGELVPSTKTCPLIIEWPEHELHDPVCGSTATLVINSPDDRTYDDLYTILPGQVRLDVYREGALYWSGTLDPETYEEPYESGGNYDVTLTFADFGVLDRMPYDLSGRQALLDLVAAALDRSGINYGSIDQNLISTTFPGGSALTLASLSLPSENFFDEDGEASTWREVLDGILQPLALRMVQRAGKIWIYDLNGLYTIPASVRALEWDGNNSTYGTPPVYNNIRVTFSPYSKGTLTPEFKYGDTTDAEPNKTTDVMVPERYSFYVDYSPGHRHGATWDYEYIGFTIFLSSDSSKCKGLAAIGPGNRYFKIVPVSGGSGSEGVAVGFRANQHSDMTPSTPIKGIDPGSHPGTLAMRTERMLLPFLAPAERERHYIRIRMEMLADPRYNPFEDAPKDGNGNENANYEAFRSWAQQAFVPVSIVVYDGNGTALYHYQNYNLTNKGYPADTVARCAKGRTSTSQIPDDGWQAGEAPFGAAWLSWYDPGLDIVEGNGVLGWKANRHSFGKPWAEGNTASKRKKYYQGDGVAREEWWSFESFKAAPEGQYIPYPPTGGYLEIRVYNGVYIFDDTDRFNEYGTGGFGDQGLYGKLRWLLYKAPEVSVVKRNLTYDEAEIGDVEYSGVANSAAKEDLEIGTICGTAPGLCATARGIYLDAATGQQVRMLARGGRTDHPEQLLIGTLYSQYAERKVSLSGEVRLDPEGLSLYSDANQPASRKFIIKRERQDIRTDSAEITAVEIRPDEYMGIEA